MSGQVALTTASDKPVILFHDHRLVDPAVDLDHVNHWEIKGIKLLYIAVYHPPEYLVPNVHLVMVLIHVSQLKYFNTCMIQFNGSVMHESNVWCNVLLKNMIGQVNKRLIEVTHSRINCQLTQ